MTSRQSLFVPARITHVQTYDHGEVRKIALTLPDTVEIAGRPVPVHDRMSPGAAFLVKPFGIRTGKHRRRMYTRSNCALDSPRILETIIDHTHKDKADTSPWWQTEEPERLWRTGGTLDVCLAYDDTQPALTIYQHTSTERRDNLILESDQQWPSMRIVAIALATGITPFLAHIRHMQTRAFGLTASEQTPDGWFSLIVSVANPRRLMEHRALLDIAADHPLRFRYHPVLAQECPDDWAWTTGRVIEAGSSGQQGIDSADCARRRLASLLALERDLHRCHLRFCGNAVARDQLLTWLEWASIEPLSFRSETW
ncbi:MAG: hypothetical protein OXU40_06755 [Nitrospira sp.]|nr:hypothetical protein [Nitrospira sp.]